MNFDRAEVQRDIVRNGVVLFVARYERLIGNGPRRHLLTESGVVADTPPGELPRDLVYISEEAAQNLAESLWREGFRPKDASPQTGELAALRAHRNDLRDVVAKLLKMEFRP